MAITFVRSADSQATKSNTLQPWGGSFAINPAIGNVLIYSISYLAGSANKVTSVNHGLGPSATMIDQRFQGTTISNELWAVYLTVQPANYNVVMTTLTSVIASTVTEWSGIDSSLIRPGVLADGSNTNAVAPTVTTGAAVVGDLIFGSYGLNGPSGDTFTQDTDVVGGSWQTNQVAVGTTGGSATSNLTWRGGQKITTASGTQTYNPTLGTARAWAGITAIFIPTQPPKPSPLDQIGSQPINRSSIW